MFLSTLLRSLEQALNRIDRVLAKARLWHRHAPSRRRARKDCLVRPPGGGRSTVVNRPGSS
jgi:hypothetical protein